MDRIHNNLWIGDIQDVQTKSLDFDTVVTVCQTSVEDNISCEYFQYMLADGEPYRGIGECTYELFERAVDKVIELVESGRDVFVHCHAGQSRSVTVCAVTISVIDDIPLRDSLDRVEEERVIFPNSTLISFANRYLNSIPHE